MTRILLIIALALSVICMVPLMGSGHTTHLHHGASVSCATCMGSGTQQQVVFPLPLVGLLKLSIFVVPLMIHVKDQFHPPRAH